MENNLELRMYGLVPYNISEIQKAIQFGHAVVEYGQMAKRLGSTELYDDWADRWKTFIILNGGTSNHSLNRYHHDDQEFQGSMETALTILMSEGIDLATFYEPDLNDMLSAIVFIVDERVFNKKLYPDFGDWIMENHYSYLADNMINANKIERMRIDGHFERGTERERKLYAEWSEIVGGRKNIFLRDYLKNFRLA